MSEPKPESLTSIFGRKYIMPIKKRKVTFYDESYGDIFVEILDSTGCSKEIHKGCMECKNRDKCVDAHDNNAVNCGGNTMNPNYEYYLYKNRAIELRNSVRLCFDSDDEPLTKEEQETLSLADAYDKMAETIKPSF